jgi:hypothetical protein
MKLMVCVLSPGAKAPTRARISASSGNIARIDDRRALHDLGNGADFEIIADRPIIGAAEAHAPEAGHRRFRDLRRDAVRQRNDPAHLARAERLVEELALIPGAVGDVEEAALLFGLLTGESVRQVEKQVSDASAPTNEIFGLSIRELAGTKPRPSGKGVVGSDRHDRHRLFRAFRRHPKSRLHRSGSAAERNLYLGPFRSRKRWRGRVEKILDLRDVISPVPDFRQDADRLAPAHDDEAWRDIGVKPCAQSFFGVRRDHRAAQAGKEMRKQLRQHHRDIASLEPVLAIAGKEQENLDALFRCAVKKIVETQVVNDRQPRPLDQAPHQRRHRRTSIVFFWRSSNEGAKRLTMAPSYARY